MNRWTAAAAATVVVLLGSRAGAFDEAGRSHTRIADHGRIASAFDLARSRSEAFQAIVDAIDASDTYVVIEDGACPGHQVRSCVHLLMQGAPAFRAIRIRVDGRQPPREIVAQLAHELRHAAEIAAHREVVDAASLRGLYRAVGYQSCSTYQTECWETREAQAAERLVSEQVRRFQALTASKP